MLPAAYAYFHSPLSIAFRWTWFSRLRQVVVGLLPLVPGALYAWDGGIEAEGGGQNVRVWGNYINNTATGVATTPVAIGPTYVFRNVYNRSRQLSQVPPELFSTVAMRMPPIVPTISSAAAASAFSTSPTTIGNSTASKPGRTISRRPA